MRFLVFLSLAALIHALNENKVLMKESLSSIPGLLALSQSCTVQVQIDFQCDENTCSEVTSPDDYDTIIQQVTAYLVEATLQDNSGDDCSEDVSVSVVCIYENDECIVGYIGETVVVHIIKEDNSVLEYEIVIEGP